MEKALSNTNSWKETIARLEPGDKVVLYRGQVEDRGDYMRLYTRWSERAKRLGVRVKFRSTPDGFTMWRVE